MTQLLQTDLYEHVRWRHPEVITFADTLLETITDPEGQEKFPSGDIIYWKELPDFIKSFVQTGCDYSVIPVGRHRKGYLYAKTCFLVNKDGLKGLKKKWQI